MLVQFFVGLVWFKADYSEIDWHGGEVEFTYADLSNGKTVLPVGCHRDYKGVKYRELPRGRVEVEKGKIVITVGKKCPKSAIDLIKKLYNLDKHENLIKEKHRSFWDSIGNKPMVGIFWYTDEYDVIISVQNKQLKNPNSSSRMKKVSS